MVTTPVRVVVTVLKFAAGILGVLVFFYHNTVFSQYAKEGTRTPDSLHKILINDHGSYSYITVWQSERLRDLLICSGVLIGVMIVFDLLQRARSKKRGRP